MQAYTYDDILLVPNKSLHSRSTAKLETKLSRNIHIDLPITSANMDTITGYELARTMSRLGGVGFLHRNMKIEENCYTVQKCLDTWKPYWSPVIPTVGVSTSERERAESLLSLGIQGICIDIANAYSDRVTSMINFIRSKSKDVDIIAGNVASGPAALFLAQRGVDAIKVGIGPGSVCTTRRMTGFGVPQFTAISMVKRTLLDHRYNQIPVIADGGIKSSGDIVKALWAGASSIMTGKLFAGCLEANNPNAYRGMASNDARQVLLSDGDVSTVAEEGIAIEVQDAGSAEDVIRELCNGIRSGMSYAGCEYISELNMCQDVRAVVQTQNGIIESGTRK
tara:strand:+ start:6561 stop:7571 length:1011 start_codon:yes stop_codon:yes gene_type:complete